MVDWSVPSPPPIQDHFAYASWIYAANPGNARGWQLYCCIQHITQESVWLCLQVTLLTVEPSDNAGPAELAYDYLRRT